MKIQKYNSLGLDVNLNVPESVTEFNQNAKKDGACLAEGINNVVYRGSLTEFRNVFLHGRKEDKENGVAAIKGLDDTTGIMRKLEPTGKKNAEGEDLMEYAEKESGFFERVLAETGKKVEDFQSLADEVAASIVFDASARERKAPQPKKLGKQWTDAATQLISTDNVSKFADKYAKILGKALDYTAGDDAAKNVLTLAAKVKEMMDEKQRQDLAKAIA